MNDYTINELWEKYLRLQKEYRGLIIEKNEDGNIRTASIWYNTVIWADQEKEKFFKKKDGIRAGAKSSPTTKKTVQKVHPDGAKSSPRHGAKSSPYTKYSYTGTNTLEEEEQHQQFSLDPKEASKPIEHITPTLKSKLTASEVGAVDVATSIDFELEAVRLIFMEICKASQPVKDTWKMKHGAKMIAAGLTSGEVIKNCAEYMRLNDRILSYLKGQTLLNEIEALPAIRFISFFQNKWLPNVKPSKVIHLANPNVVPTSTLYNYIN